MELIRSEYTSTTGKDTIQYNTWLGEGRKGIVHITHGMCEHMDRYDEFARYLVENGYIVCGQNHLGHGTTAKETLGYFAPKGGDRVLVEDTHKLTALLKETYPGIPYILLGHSMGSFVARNYFAKYGREVDVLIISGTSGKNPLSLPLKGICKVQKVLKGKKSRVRFIANLSAKVYLAKINQPKSPFDWLSHDEHIVKAYSDDRFCHYTFTASGYDDLMSLLRACNRGSWYAAIPKDTPMLLISGEEDVIGNYGKGVVEVHDKLKRVGVRDITLKLYPNMRHEVLNEIGKEEAYQFILNYIDEKVMYVTK